MGNVSIRKFVFPFMCFGIANSLLTGCLFGENKQFFQTTLPVPALVGASGASSGQPTLNSDICVNNPSAAACNTTPVVSTPGVVTILFTMSQIPQASGTLILANAIKYASPINNPKILFLKDYNTNGEDEGDPAYIKDVLLAGYNVEYGVIASGGLLPSVIADKDLVIVSNPGYPLSNSRTLQTLQAFTGGVILVGDDMAQGAAFSVESLTGLHVTANGTSMSCNGQTYRYDNLAGSDYQVSLNTEFMPGVPAQYQHYQYGNDLDWTTALAGTQVLAYAEAAPGTCDVGLLPAIARHPK